MAGPVITTALGVQAKKEFQDIVLSARQDDFFGKNMYSNFGDLGTAVKSLVDEFQKHTANSRNLNTIREMQNFVENFSEFSAAQRNAGKHVTLVSELSRLVDARTLMQVRASLHPLVPCQLSNLFAGSLSLKPNNSTPMYEYQSSLVIELE